MTALHIDIDAQLKFLIDLLNIHSPTGYHKEAIAYCKEVFAALNIPDLTMTTTNKGALVLQWKGESDSEPRAVTAHVDTLGLIVKEIKSNGCLECSKIGGLTLTGAEYEGVTVRTYDDRRYRGTFLSINPSGHVNERIEKQERSLKNMEVRLDVKTSSAKETRDLGIEVGDFVFVDPRVEYIIESGFLRSRFLDDKAGVANIYGAILALKEAGLRPAQDTTFLISIYEEVGHGGSSGIPSNVVELLTIDMGAIGDGQNGDEFSVSISGSVAK